MTKQKYLITRTEIQNDIYTMYNNKNKGQDFKPWLWKRTKLLCGICLVIQRVKLRNNLSLFLYFIRLLSIKYILYFVIRHKTKFDIRSKWCASHVAIPHWSEMCWLRKGHFVFGFKILFMVLASTDDCYIIILVLS